MNTKIFAIAALGLTLGGCNATVYDAGYYNRPLASVYVPPPVYVAPRPYYVRPYTYNPYVYRSHPLPPRRPHYYHPYR